MLKSTAKFDRKALVAFVLTAATAVTTLLNHPARSQDSESRAVYFVSDRVVDRARGGDIELGAQTVDNLQHLVYGERDPGTSLYGDFEQFVAKLKARLAASGSDRLVIFIHGCCVDFEKASAQATELASRMKPPVILYDWGTPSKSYAGSLIAYPRSQDRFNTFIDDLARAFPNKQITLVGYSLGNQLVVDYCLQHQFENNGAFFQDIVMARPDLDSVAFNSALPKIAAKTNRVHLFVADNDWQINLSSFLRVIASPTSEAQRVGFGKQAPSPNPKLSVIDVSGLKLQHDVPYSVISELIENGGALPVSAKYSYRSEQGYTVVKANKEDI